jgi:hypothetical protein
MQEFFWRPTWAEVRPESEFHPHTPEELGDKFLAADGGSTEYEVLDWLHATIRLLKPTRVLETGGFKGIGTAAMAHACKLNGFGRVFTIEHDANCCARIEETLQDCRLREWVDVHWANSTDFLLKYDYDYDIAFFDSETSIRTIECGICLKRNLIKKVAVFHDTSESKSSDLSVQRDQEQYRNTIKKLSTFPTCTGYYDSKLSRGFIALFFAQ